MNNVVFFEEKTREKIYEYNLKTPWKFEVGQIFQYYGMFDFEVIFVKHAIINDGNGDIVVQHVWVKRIDKKYYENA